MQTPKTIAELPTEIQVDNLIHAFSIISRHLTIPQPGLKPSLKEKLL